MGVLNVTPDSFSDGGRYLAVDAAIGAGLQMMADGADLIDVGGESTRPGAEPVPADEELDRIYPVVTGLVRANVPVSIDTMKASVAHAAVEAGAVVVNDISAMGDPEMLDVIKQSDVSVCLMHMQGAPQTMQNAPRYGDVVSEVVHFLTLAAKRLELSGVSSERIWIDPGIGFGKTDSHNLELLGNLYRLVATKHPVLIGISRKGFLGRVLGGVPQLERLPAALALQSLAQEAGVRVIRTHEVVETRRAIEAVAALREAAPN
jgi:dihydropteroate synthase